MEGTKSLQPGTGPLMDQTGTLISDFEFWEVWEINVYSL